MTNCASSCLQGESGKTSCKPNTDVEHQDKAVEVPPDSED
ncbi:hypothetical protein L581_0047 [Serratia fonticola AU-AP2C]|nr:hypothetical protein L581_0047 [Serratia fonticola AU-AP2C]